MEKKSQDYNVTSFLKSDTTKIKSNALEIPTITLPKGGGAIKSIDEKFSVNPVNGTFDFGIPIPVSEARGFSPSISLTYSSGAGNGIFGLGWSLDVPSIKRKTNKRLPTYHDEVDSDIFFISGGEELVPARKRDGDGAFIKNNKGEYEINELTRDFFGKKYLVRTYCPEMEGAFARIERWTNIETKHIHWRTINRDNITAIFGKSSEACIANPLRPEQVFEWFLEFSFDDKGNAIYYQYKTDDDSGLPHTLHNKNRRAALGSYAGTYLKHIYYGIRRPYINQGEIFSKERKDYFFETVLDYGEHDLLNPPFNESRTWNFRDDAFSEYRAGFEVRTTRLCQRVLLYHHMDELPGGTALIRSLEFTYDNNGIDGFTFLKEVTSCGYIKKSNGEYSQKSMPPLQFSYQHHEWNTSIKSLEQESLIHAPGGVKGGEYHFVDLFGEGLSGILTEQADGWYYKNNLGSGKFSPARRISPTPSFRGLNRQVQLLELGSDGEKQLASINDGGPKGYYELNDKEEWQPFKRFDTIPSFQSDTNSRLLDLTGDGLLDILQREPNGFLWYPSQGRKGYAPAQKIIQDHDEEWSPTVIFSDAVQQIFLADMSGDGLVDIVRIKNGEVCYWPNLGYARFGAKISMDNVSPFDYPERFNPKYIKLVDVDGSGTSDIVYLGKHSGDIYLNQQGNRLSDRKSITLPEINEITDFDVMDLLGNGVACLVWSSPLQKHRHLPSRYVDLMNSKKPHVMTSYKNNLGKEVHIEYTPSTKFYIQDRDEGRPWNTKLHFPVYCVSQIKTLERITQSSWVSTYSYHHGYYDRKNMEFRGFGRVDQMDAEYIQHWTKGANQMVLEKSLQQAPVLTRSWFCTGANFDKKNLHDMYKHEYWFEEMSRQGHEVVHDEVALPDPHIVTTFETGTNELETADWCEALQACKGMGLRTEVFVLDAPLQGAMEEQIIKALTPVSVTSTNCIINRIQPKMDGRHGVYMVQESEVLTYQYERNTRDPRISHTLSIKHDEYGNVLESVSIAYGRVFEDPALPQEVREQQSRLNITFTKNRFTHDVIGEDIYRLRLPSEVMTYEVKGLDKVGILFSVQDFRDLLSQATFVTYDDWDRNPSMGNPTCRLIEHVRTLYLGNDLETPLPLHALESLALPYENYVLAFTPSLLASVYGDRVNDSIMLEGKYIHSEGDQNWWIRSGVQQFIVGTEVPSQAALRFYLPVSYVDPYGSTTTIHYYKDYYLFMDEVEDTLGNRSRVDSFNFCTLSPERIIDINDNISEVLYDELGLVKAQAFLGKGDEADDLIDLRAFTTGSEKSLIDNFFVAETSTELIALGKDLLQHATTRLVYDLHRFIHSNGTEPAVVATIQREEHFHHNPDSAIQLSFEYSDGHGSVVMKKNQAEPGKGKSVELHSDNSYTVTETDTRMLNPTQLRWVGNGRVVRNNKGNPVKQYEPYFSITHRYESFKELVETGVTDVLYYDALGRLVKTIYPNGTFDKMEFDSWKQAIWDCHDTVKESTWYHHRTNRLMDATLIASGKDPEYEKAAADQAAAHAHTPTIVHLDNLGRPILTIEHNRDANTTDDIFLLTRMDLDIEGNLYQVRDARDLPENNFSGNAVVKYFYDMLGNRISLESMDAGKRWIVNNILGLPLRTWDERNYELQYIYDSLHRPLKTCVIGGEDTMPVNQTVDFIQYGEDESDATHKNLRGRIVRHYDTGGMVETPAYDFKGQPLSISRQLFKDYKSIPNWTGNHFQNDLELERYTFISEYDALGRIVKEVKPDGSIFTSTYNKTGLLFSQKVIHADPSITRVYLKSISYNEKGQRTKVVYGNDVISHFNYDLETFKLLSLTTRKKGNSIVQDLRYTYDGMGNITHIQNQAVATNFYNNMKVEPAQQFVYDALYRLIEATGRENNSAFSFGEADRWQDLAFMQVVNPGDPMVIRNYTQYYQYDNAGNILQMKHLAPGNNWTRNYVYEKGNNRLKNTQVGGKVYHYAYHDKHGFIKSLPHLDEMHWGFKEELIRTAKQKVNPGNGTPETTYYQYDGQGQRLRKVTEGSAPEGYSPTKKEERYYFSGYEVYRKHQGSHAGLQRISLSLTHHGQRYAWVETRNAIADNTVKQLARYQLHNHLGSSVLELDQEAKVISFEEYHPYGTTAYQAVNAAIKSAAKRYRYSAKERDEETGLEYHQARYYLPWLGRWLNSDPKGIQYSVNVYSFTDCNPIMGVDLTGWGTETPMTADEFAKGLQNTVDDLNNTTDDIVVQDRRTRSPKTSFKVDPLPDPEGNFKSVTPIKGKGELVTGPYSKVAGHHPLQSSAYKNESGKDPLHSKAHSVSQKEGALSLPKSSNGNPNSVAHVRSGKIQSAVDQGRLGKEVNKLNPKDVAGKLPESSVVSAGNGKLVGGPGPWAEEVKGLYGLTAGGVHPQDALNATMIASEERRAAGMLSSRIPVPKSKWNKVKEGVLSVTEKATKSKAVKVMVAVAPILMSGVAKATPLVGTAVGAADVVNEAQTGGARRGTLAAIGMSEIPLVSQAADLGLAAEDAGWAAKEILDPNDEAEDWYYRTFLK